MLLDWASCWTKSWVPGDIWNTMTFIWYHCDIQLCSNCYLLTSILTLISAAKCTLSFFFKPWASYQISKIVCCVCAGNAGNVFPATDVTGNTLLAISAWCMSGLLTSGGVKKRSRHSRRMRNPQFYLSGKRPMVESRYNTAFHLIHLLQTTLPDQW